MCQTSLFCPQYWSNLRNPVQTFHKVQNGVWFCLYPFHHLGQRTHLLDLSLEALHMLENDCSLCFLKDPLLITSSSRQMHMGTKNLKIYCRYNYFIKLIQSYFQLVAQHIGLSEKNYDFSDNSKTKISYHPGYLLSSAPVIIQSSRATIEANVWEMWVLLLVERGTKL